MDAEEKLYCARCAAMAGLILLAGLMALALDALSASWLAELSQQLAASLESAAALASN